MRRFISCLTALFILFTFAPFTPQTALAMTYPDTIPESVVFTQRGTDSMGLTLPAVLSALPSTYGQGYDRVGWAFAAANVLEQAAAKSLGYPISFSVNHMRYALSSDSGNTYGFSRGYTAAGNRSQTAAYLMRGTMNGPVYTASDPYSPGLLSPGGSPDTPRPLADTARHTPELRTTGVIYIPDLPANPSAADKALYLRRLKEHIQTYGAAAASLCYDDAALENGVYRGTGANPPDHTVTLLGWNDTYEYTAGETTGTGVFIAADSAYDNGRGGSYYITYDTVLKNAYTVSGLTRELYDKVYEHDSFGLTGTTGFASDTAYFASVFTVTSAAELLEAVTFFAAGENTRISVYLINLDDSSINEQLAAAVTAAPAVLEDGDNSFTAALPGYYTAALAEPWSAGASGTRFAVIVKAVTPYETAPIPLQSASADTRAAAGHCYISSGGSDWVDAYSNNRAAVCLKAHVTTEADIPLESILLNTSDTRVVNGISYGLLKTAPGQTLSAAPVLTPGNANDQIAVEWFFGDEFANEESFILQGRYEKPDPDASPPPSETPAPSPSAVPAVNSIDPKTGMLSARVLGDFSLRCVMVKEDGTKLSSTILVSVSDIGIESITLDKAAVTLKTNQTVTVKAAMIPTDATVPLKWMIAADEYYNPFPLEYDPDNLYGQGRPLAVINEKGKVTPIAPGVCYVYAMSEDGSVRSPLCKLTINEVAMRGIYFSKKTLTLSSGTVFTLAAKSKPADATYQDFSFSSSDPSVVTADPTSGVLRALSAGKAKITAVSRKGGFIAECTVTVTDKPTKTLKLGATYTVQPVGTLPDLTVHWAFDGAPAGDPTKNEYFNFTQTKTKTKVTASEPGFASLRAYQIALVDEDGDGIHDEGAPETVVWEQSFYLAAVVGSPKLKLMNEDGETIKKITISIDENNPSRTLPVTVLAGLQNPGDATMLAFEWDVRNDAVARVDVDQSNPLRVSAQISALSAGTTKLTVINYNQNKRITLSIRVINYPNAVTFDKPADTFIKQNRKMSVRAKVNKGKNDKTLMYFLEDAGNEIPHTEENPVAKIDGKGRLTALRPGTVRVTAVAAPFDEGAARASKLVTVNLPLSKISFQSRSISLSAGETAEAAVKLAPAGTTEDRFIVYSQDESVARVYLSGGVYYIQALKPGKARIMAESLDNPRKKAYATVRVR